METPGLLPASIASGDHAQGAPRPQLTETRSMSPGAGDEADWTTRQAALAQHASAHLGQHERLAGPAKATLVTFSREVEEADVEAGFAVGSSQPERAPLLPARSGSVGAYDASSDGMWFHDGSSDHLSPIGDLAALKKSSSELDGLLASRWRTRATKVAVHGYYLAQNELIDSLLETEQIHRGQYTNDEAAEAAQVRRALNLSFASNCVLLVVRAAIAIVAGSLSLAVATLDAVLDVISSAMLYYTSWSAARRDKYSYPVGKERMEPLGVVVFSTVMGTAAFSVIVESIKALVAGDGADIARLNWVVGGTLGVVAMKLCLFLYCRGSRSPAVQAFALDHWNDVLVNGVGLAGAVLGARVAPQWDPAIAIALSLWVVWAWGNQAREHILNLVGQAAPPSILQKLTFLTFYHDPRLLYIDTVRAFSFGSTFIAEVDIVLPPDMPLRVAHDIGESLQFKLEQLPEVARAYVHLDWETTHRPEHESLPPGSGPLSPLASPHPSPHVSGALP